MSLHEPGVPIIGAILGGIALVLSIYAFKRTLDFQAYRELDSNYMDILKESLKHPYLRNLDKISKYDTELTGDDKLRYETYAYLVWNMCETVYDRRKVDETWLPLIKEEKRLHLAWFKNPNNQPKFKREFRDYIMQENIPKRSGWLAK